MSSQSLWKGVFSGVVSTLTFMVVHHFLISNIWFMVLPMVVAGALCGAVVSWSYHLLLEIPSRRSWLFYNFIYVALFGFLGVASVLIFDPVISMADVMELNGPPTALIDQAMPMTVLFTLGMAMLIALLYKWNLMKFFAVLLTSVVLVMFLGLNVSAIGLVDISSGSWVVIGELFGLIVVLNAVYMLVYMISVGWFHVLLSSPITEVDLPHSL